MGKSDKISTYDTIAWVDTETTGLRPESANVIDLAIVITDQDCNILDSYETKLKLSNAAKAAARVVDSDTAKALAVNGYNEAEWADAVESDRTVWQKVYRMTEKRTFGGQNTPFDAGFLTAEMNRFGIRPRWVRRLLDTTSFAIIVMNDLGITDPKTGFPSANLQLIYEALGGPEVPAHRAMGDVQRCIYLYKYFREGYFRVKEHRALGALVASGKVMAPGLVPNVESRLNLGAGVTTAIGEGVINRGGLSRLNFADAVAEADPDVAVAAEELVEGVSKGNWDKGYVLSADNVAESTSPAKPSV